jgi:streptogramin lyase
MRRTFLLTLAVAGACVGLYCAQGSGSAPPEGELNVISGLGTLSGVVEAPRPFSAGMVYARHVSKNVLYVVYTRGGRYQAPHLFPGEYEVTVRKNGFTSDMQRVTVKASENAVLNVALREVDPEPLQQSGFAGSPRAWSWDRNKVELVSHTALYPAGDDYERLKGQCLRCHGLNFFPSNPSNAARWERAIDRMTDPKVDGGMIPPGALTPQDRERIVAYLARNFGPDKPRRALRLDSEMPLDEAALARAMYVEYGIPENGRAGDTHFDSTGNVWFSDLPNRISRLDPRTGVFTRQSVIPKGLTEGPHDLEVDRQDNVWWIDNVDDGHLGKLDPKTGNMVGYAVNGHGHSHTLDSQNNVWFTLPWDHQIGKWDRQTERVKLWKPPTPHSNPMGILVDRNGMVWFAGFESCQVVGFDPRTETFTEYPALARPCTSPSLAVDSRGTVWYSVPSRSKLGALNAGSGERVEYDMPASFSAPRSVVADPQDNIWVSDGGHGGAMVRFNPRTKAFTYFPTPEKAQQNRNIQVTREGAIWYGVQGNAVGVLYPDVARMTTLAAHPYR